MSRTEPNDERFIVVSDNHPFVGRVFDLAMPLHLGFGSFEELATYPDCLYVVMVERRLSLLVARVESLNVVGDMLWPSGLPNSFRGVSLSRYDWIKVAMDALLMRFISILDCALLLANEVFEAKVPPRSCNMRRLAAKHVSQRALADLKALNAIQATLRQERNERFHHGVERMVSDDDTTFRMAANFERWGHGLTGTDRHGRPVDSERYFLEVLEALRTEFATSVGSATSALSELYDTLRDEFEVRFSMKFRARTKPLPW